MTRLENDFRLDQTEERQGIEDDLTQAYMLYDRGMNDTKCVLIQYVEEQNRRAEWTERNYGNNGRSKEMERKM